MNIWMTGKKYMKHDYLKKEHFHSHLNMKDITNAGYAHAKRICSDLKIRNLGDYLDLYVLSDTFIASWCIWELWKYKPWNIWAWSCSFSYHARTSMTISFKKGWSKIISFKQQITSSSKANYKLWRCSYYIDKINKLSFSTKIYWKLLRCQLLLDSS